ncbi:MAG: type II secretion system protein GspG [Planctomycetes bacterium]|nr:type II secretion system protein GspG [Planctomycetota bacterium]
MKVKLVRRLGPNALEGTARVESRIHATARNGGALSREKRLALALAGLAALPAFSPIQTTDRRREVAKREVSEIVAAIEGYRKECGELPDCLHLLVLPDEKGKAFLSRKGMPVDPWGTPYEYDYSEFDRGRWNFEVQSYGSDGRPGGEGEAADIGLVSAPPLPPLRGRAPGCAS